MMTRRWSALAALAMLLLACSFLTNGNPAGDPDVDADVNPAGNSAGAPALENASDPNSSAAEQGDGTVDEPLGEQARESDGDEAAAFFAADCPFAAPATFEVTCGYLAVPENRTRPESATIELAIAVVHAAVDEGRPPIIYLAGGPGGSALDEFAADPEGWRYPFTETRDLILLDQRGTGHSEPSLDCPELAVVAAFTDENPDVLCRDRLVGAGIDLAAYNTAENAADVAALRRALGITEWDLLGISYGTRLALTIMRDHPEGVRSAVLDSVFPPNADTPVVEALAPLWSLQELFAECAGDVYCAENYPDLEAAFLETVSGLNDAPIEGLFGDDLVFAVSNALNDTSLIPLIPSVIYAVAGGDTGALDELVTDESGFARPAAQPEEDRSDSEGMYNSVICHEEYVFDDYEAVEARVVAEIPDELEAALLRPVFDLFQLCSFWGAGRAAALENEAVHSSIPTLLLAGQYDVATPREWAYLAAETLTHAFVLEIPGAGHSILSTDACAVDITASFLDAPAQQPDSRCLEEIEWPYFE